MPPTLEVLPKPAARVGGSADGAIDLVLESGTRDIAYIGIITVRKNDGGVQWYHNDLSDKELVWLLERGKLAILQSGQKQSPTRA